MNLRWQPTTMTSADVRGIFDLRISRHCSRSRACSFGTQQMGPQLVTQGRAPGFGLTTATHSSTPDLELLNASITPAGKPKLPRLVW